MAKLKSIRFLMMNFQGTNLGSGFTLLFVVTIDERCGNIKKQVIKLKRGHLSNEDLVLVYF